MAALSDNRETPQLEQDKGYQAEMTILNDAVMYAGGIIAIDYLQEVQPAANTQGLIVVGCNKSRKVDNADDGETMPVNTGIYLLDNSSTYPIVLSGALGAPQVAYVEDDQTVAAYASVRVAAGIVRDVTSAGVYVDMSPAALKLARSLTPSVEVAKTDDYTATAAICWDGRTVIKQTGAAKTLTLPSAVAGMKIGIYRGSASAGQDVSVQAATGDKVEGSDGFSAASKKIDNTVDAISDILWLQAVTNTHWAVAAPGPKDFTSWVKNDA